MPGKCPYFKTLLWLILHSIKSFLLLIVLRITNGPLSPHLCPLAILLGSSWLIQRIINILSRATVHALNAECWNFNGNQIEINPEIWFWRYHLEIQVNSCITAESLVIGIDTKIEVIVVSPTTWEAHHSPRAKKWQILKTIWNKVHHIKLILVSLAFVLWWLCHRFW